MRRVAGVTFLIWVVWAGPQIHVAQAEDGTDQLETVIVTGSFVPRIDTDTPSPLAVISSEDIAHSGLTSTADIVHTLTADNSGTLPTSFVGTAAGAAGVSLRGLTVNSTLVLIDGHRSTNYPLADDGQRTFVDLNTIPLDVVDHIEVLKDGASSVYGADAIAGVVNIILKKTFTGLQTSAEVGTSSHGDGTMRRGTLTVGRGHLDSGDRFNAYFNLEYEKDGAIRVGDRGFPFNTNDLTPIGGNNLNPQPSVFPYGTIYGSATPGTVTGTLPNGQPDLTTGVPNPGAVSQPLRPCPAGLQATDGAGNVYCKQTTLLSYYDQPQQERINLYGRMTVQLTDATQVYLSAGFFQNEVVSDLTYPQIQSGIPHNTNSLALPPLLPTGALNPNNPFANAACAAVNDCPYALINFAFPQIQRLTTTNHVFRTVAGVDGEADGWQYHGALVINHASLDFDNTGLLSYNQLINDVTNGTYDFLNPAANSAATNAALLPEAQKTSTTDLYALDFSGSRLLAELPGGRLGLALGAQWRRESSSDPNINSSLDYQGLGVTQIVGQRQVAGFFAELDARILESVEVIGSGRYDHYSDFGSAVTPKIGVRFKPFEPLALHATYSRGFRAPSFAENGSSYSEVFFPYIPPPDFQAAHSVGGIPDGYVQQYTLAQIIAGNPNLRPEKSHSVTAGFDFKPLPALSLSADYYLIRKTGVIVPSFPGPVLAAYYAGAPLPPGSTVTPDNPDPAFPNLPPRPTTVAAPYINANSEETDGVDVNAQLQLDIGPGRWTSQASWTDIFSFKVTQPDGTVLSYVGTQAPYILSSGAGTPRQRATWTNTWKQGRVTASVIGYYVSGFDETGVDATGSASTTEACLYTTALGTPFPAGCHIGSFIYFDLTGEIQVAKGFNLNAAIQNIGGRKPPIDPADYAGVNFNTTYHQAGIVGRYFRIGARYTF